MSHRGIFNKTHLLSFNNQSPSMETYMYLWMHSFIYAGQGLGGLVQFNPLVQFNLYQGEVLPYNPGTRDWVESETPQAPTQSVRGQTSS